MQKIVLNNGVEMPILGLGVMLLNDPEQGGHAIKDAIATGYRLIDTAAAYMNEVAVGKAIKGSGVPRKEFFITTKLWIQDASYEGAKNAFDKSLKRLGLDYLDLYLIHQPIGDVIGAWRAMEEVYKGGKVKAIGISNFHPDQVMNLLMHSTVVPAVNQVQIHPFHQQIGTQRFLMENTIQIEGWSPLAEGKFDIFTNEVLVSIAKKHKKSVAQVVLRWNIQRGIVAIPKSVHKERIEENFNVFDFQLSDDDMESIKTLDTTTKSIFNNRDPEMIKMMVTNMKLDI
jgi:2,5-diketo-D-gluconate reductase A